MVNMINYQVLVFIEKNAFFKVRLNDNRF